MRGSAPAFAGRVVSARFRTQCIRPDMPRLETAAAPGVTDAFTVADAFARFSATDALGIEARAISRMSDEFYSQRKLEASSILPFPSYLPTLGYAQIGRLRPGHGLMGPAVAMSCPGATPCSTHFTSASNALN